jgi:hypothetical protein
MPLYHRKEEEWCPRMTKESKAINWRADWLKKKITKLSLVLIYVTGLLMHIIYSHFDLSIGIQSYPRVSDAFMWTSIIFLNYSPYYILFVMTKKCKIPLRMCFLFKSTVFKLGLVVCVYYQLLGRLSPRFWKLGQQSKTPCQKKIKEEEKKRTHTHTHTHTPFIYNIRSTI